MNPLAPRESPRMTEKSPDAFRTISEVAQDLDLPQHVLRFWETRFPQIKPLKRGGGRRYYRPDDVDLLRGIRELLYGRGYTIRGVQRILKQDGPRFVQAIGRGERTIEAPPPGVPDQGSHSDETFGAADVHPAIPMDADPAGSGAEAPRHDRGRDRIALALETRQESATYPGLGPRAS